MVQTESTNKNAIPDRRTLTSQGVDVIMMAYKESKDNVLVFLPGAGDIIAMESRLRVCPHPSQVMLCTESACLVLQSPALATPTKHGSLYLLMLCASP